MPCDHWFETHISNIEEQVDHVCKCIVVTDRSYDIIFDIKNIIRNGTCAEIELINDSIHDNFYYVLKDFSDCVDYKLFWIDDSGKKHEYKISGYNTIGNNNGIYLKEIQ